MKTWNLSVEVKVSDNWIEDGFDMKQRLEQLEDDIRGMLPYAHHHEMKIKVKITKAPDPKEVRKLQGYE